MNKSKIIYDMFIEGVELTTNNLNNHGLNSRDIKKLIDENVIERIQRGHYRLIDPVYKLFGYGKECMRVNKDLGNKCFKKCLEIYPKHYLSAYELFLSCILNQNFKESIPYLEVLYNQNKRVFGLHLYLISFIVDLPEDLKEIACDLTYEDIKLTNQNTPNLKYENYVRKMAINNKLISASQYLNGLVELTSGVNLYQQVVRILIQNAIKVFDNIIDYERKLIKEEDYIGLQSFLEKSTNFRRLSKTETYLLKLTKEILRIENTDKLPSVNNEEVVDVFLAIDNNNYKLALKISANQFQKYHDGNLIYLMLLNINDLINNKIKKEKEDNAKYIQDFYIALSQNDFETARNLLSKVLSSEDKESLENLLRMSEALVKPKEKNESETTIEEDIEEYLRKKYKYMKESNTPILLLDAMSLEHEEIAKNIIKKIPDLKYHIIGHIVPHIVLRIEKETVNIYNSDIKKAYTAKSYDRVIELAKEKLHSVFNVSVILYLIRALIRMGRKEEAVNYFNILAVSFDNYGLNNNVNALLDAVITKDPNLDAMIERNVNVNYIDPDLKELIVKEREKMIKENRAFFILPSTLSDDETKIKVKNINKIIPDLWSFRAFKHTGNDRIIVMRNKSIRINLDETIQSIKTKLNTKDYLGAISDVHVLLSSFTPAKYSIMVAISFHYLGKAYLGLKKYEEALLYFKISDDITIDVGRTPEHTSVINFLEQKTEVEEKPAVKISAEELSFGKPSAGIDDNSLIEKASLICGTGVDVHEACVGFSLDLNEEALVNLILARDSYIQGLINIGDMYLRNAEKIPNKSDNVKKLLSDLQVNKLFYKGRKKDGYKPLVILPIKDMA